MRKLLKVLSTIVGIVVASLIVYLFIHPINTFYYDDLDDDSDNDLDDDFDADLNDLLDEYYEGNNF